VAALHREQGPLNLGLRGRGGAQPLELGELARRRHVVLGAEDQPDPLVAQRPQMAVRLAHRDPVVGRDGREADVVDGRVDEHGGQSALGHPVVVLVLSVALRVVAAGEDDPGDVLLQQHVHVVALGHPFGGTGAEHGREAALGQRPGDHLGEGREDWVGQLGQDQADQPGPLAA